jgi:hypothetical protein
MHAPRSYRETDYETEMLGHALLFTRGRVLNEVIADMKAYDIAQGFVPRNAVGLCSTCAFICDIKPLKSAKSHHSNHLESEPPQDLHPLLLC